MSNLTHFKVLLKKNFLTLKRKWGFLLFFIMLPIVTLGLFSLIVKVMQKGTRPEGHNFDYLYFSSTQTFESSEPQFSNTNISSKVYSSINNCKIQSFTDFAIVGTQDMIDAFYSTAIDNLKNYGFTGHNYTDRDDLFDIVRKAQVSTYCFGLQIDKFDTATDDYEFQVMWMKKDIPDTNADAYDITIKNPDLDNWNKYKNSGYMGIYQVIINTILEKKKLNGYSMDVAYMPLKTPEFQIANTQLQTQLAKLFPFFFIITFLIPLYYMVTKLAEERESKAREGMKMMGLKDSSYMLSWFVFYLIIQVVMSLEIVAVVSINVFPQSNKLLVFLFCMFYGLSLFGFALVIVAVLPTTRSSATAASLLHLITYFIAFALTDDYSTALKLPLCIIPNVGLAIGLQNLYHYENQSNGLTFNTASLYYQNMTFYGAFFMILLSCFLLIGLGLYLDQILASQFGVPKKWYFLCTRNFWCGKRRQRKTQEERQETNSLINHCDCEDEEIKNPHDFENIPEVLKRQEYNNECLQIKCLRKTFGEKVAVENSNISMYNGQIFALLGHNGAGKTTTISMLTGLLQATKGTAKAFGLNIFEDMDEFRKVLGVCPQHDVLFEYLTPKEHLEIFAAFKGTPNNKIEEEVNKMLYDIDLLGQKDQLAKTLSGGQKRKLSVAIAMIGNSKVIILDEPSSGMDTSSRRRLWEMLKQSKNGRIIILTTHYMDEADILGDRICIMAEGRIKCCGSSLFLKNRYGSGYNLVIAKKSRDPAPQIDQFIHEYIKGAKKLQEVSSETAFQLPVESISEFKEFFRVLDENLDSLGIRSYGIGITTLEEVFLRIAKDKKDEDNDDSELKRFTLKSEAAGSDYGKNLQALEDYSISEQHEEGFINVFLLNLGALMKKKILLLLRDPRNLFIEIVFPIVFIFAGLALSQIKVFSDGGPRELTPGLFPTPSHLYYNDPVPVGAGNSTQFVESYFTDDFWDTPNKLTIDTSSGDYVTMLSQFDDALYNTHGTLQNPIYGEYYLYNINGLSDKSYAAFVIANATSQDAVAAYGAYIHQAFLQSITGNAGLKLKLTSQPLPITLKEQGVASAASGTSVSIVIAIAYMMVSDSLIQNIIRERRQNVKHQMIVSGVNLPAYWMSHYLIDILWQAPPSICAIIGIKLFDLDFPYLWVIILLFLFANPIFVYTLSNLFDSDASGSITIRLLYLILGAVLPIGIQFLLVIESTKDFGIIFKWFFYIFPIYSLNQGVGLIANRAIMAYQYGVKSLDPLSMEIGLPSIIFMVIDVFVFWAILAIIETKVLKRFFRRQREAVVDQEQNIDEDILEEEKRVENADPQNTTVKVDRIQKFYGNVQAVKRISFGLEYGECFALLGVSGAGKTTTFKCVTGEETPSIGQVLVCGNDVKTTKGFENARRQIGYCPQFDAIFDTLTVREHLEFYAKVKGIMSSIRQQMVEKTLDEMDLREFEKVRAGNLSGGNKRKLSVAMAIIGNPPIILLDEPSTGVDPKAKRFMWTIVSKISTQRKKSSVIITTHSMEEAEALCTKMGIMVAGRFKCFGSSQHIKAKYGTGYEIELKVKYLKEDNLDEIKENLQLRGLEQRIERKTSELILDKFNAQYLLSEISKDGSGSDFWNDFEGPEQNIDIDSFIRWVFTETRGNAITEKFEQMFKQSEILEHFNNTYKFKVSKDNYSIGYIFGMMEDIKEEFSINEYSVSQTTLEQIFNNFAREAETLQQRRKTHPRKSEANKNGQEQFRLKSEKEAHHDERV